MPINGESTQIDERHSRVHPPHATTLSRQHKTSSKYKAVMPRRTTSLIPLARIPSQIPSTLTVMRKTARRDTAELSSLSRYDKNDKDDGEEEDDQRR